MTPPPPQFFNDLHLLTDTLSWVKQSFDDSQEAVGFAAIVHTMPLRRQRASVLGIGGGLADPCSMK